jgi:hypothetical protein
MSYTFVKITSFYRIFLKDYYSQYPEITMLPYKQQFEHLMQQGYGYADFFAKEFANIGINAHELVYNAGPLQRTWAKENGSNNIGNSLLIDQLKTFRPEVVMFQDSTGFTAEFIKQLRKEVKSIKLITGLCCSPYTEETLKSYKEYDFVLACSPQFVNILNHYEIPNYLFYHSFYPGVLDRIDKREKDIELLFIGSFLSQKDFHSDRLFFVKELLNAHIPLKIAGNVEINKGLDLRAKQTIYSFTKTLEQIGLGPVIAKHPVLKKFMLLKSMPEKTNVNNAFLKAFISGPKFGYSMYSLLARAIIGFNIHGGIAGDFAANVRMFEVTGVGSLLVTDRKQNLTNLFEEDKEIIAYDTVEECVDKVKYLLSKPDKCNHIANQGQKRTLKDHTVGKRVEMLHQIITEKLKTNEWNPT